MPRVAKNVRLEPELWDRVRAEAKARGCTMTDLIEAAVLIALADPPGSRTERARRALDLPGERKPAWL